MTQRLRANVLAIAFLSYVGYTAGMLVLELRMRRTGGPGEAFKPTYV